MMMLNIQVGSQITRSGDPLRKISLERLYQGICRPKQHFQDQIKQLRMVSSIDPGAYRQLKKELPYFVCGLFHPAIRRTEYFGRIQVFLLDLDHLAAAGIAISDLCERLRKMEQVLLFFISPGGDGIKVMFRLTEACSDAALFSSFYKIFATQFAAAHQLESVIDYRTSDVTRACFISYDPQAYYHPDAVAIEMDQYLNSGDFAASEKVIREADQILRKQQKAVEKEPLDEDVLAKIKARLHPGKKPKVKKDHYVPRQIDEALAQLPALLAAFEMQIKKTEPISYGRKIIVEAANHWAEINLFFGKKGFTVVKTTKSGSHAELADLACQVLEQQLHNIKVTKNG